MTRSGFLPARVGRGTRPRPAAALRGIELASCLAWMIGAWLLSTIFVSPWWSVAAIGSFVWLLVLFVRVQPFGAALILPLLIEKASDVVALALIAFGVKIPELGTVGDAGGHGTAFTVYVALFLLGYGMTFRLVNGATPLGSRYPLSPLFDRFANIVGFALIGICGLMALDLMASGARSGFPLLTHTDRFLFRRVSADKLTVYILNLKFMTSFLLGFVVFVIPSKRIARLLASAVFVLLMILYFLFGDKFFTMLSALAGFFSPFLYTNARKVLDNVGRYAIAGSFALVAVFGVTWFIYSDGGRQNPAATMEKLSGRMVGQGELWFLQYELGAPIWDWNGAMIDRNLAALSVKEVDLYALRESIGPSYYSNGYAPNDIRASIHRNAGSVTYTQALEPLGLATFGWGGLAVMMAVVGGFTALVTSYVAYAIRARSIAMAVFASYVFLQARTMLSQGTPWVLFSAFSAKWLAVILLIELVLYCFGLSQRTPRPRSRISRMKRIVS